MKVICTQENLKNGLQTVSRIITTSNTLPILNNVLLKTEHGLLTLSATNLEIGITTQIRCKVEIDGAVCLPAKTLSDLVSSLPNSTITLEVENNGVSIKTDRYFTLLKSLPSEDFPLIPKIEEGLVIRIGPETLKSAFEQVIFAVSTNETQPEISGVYVLPGTDSLKLVATDRYRLAEKTLAIKTSGSSGVIIPHRAAAELSRIMANTKVEVEITITENQVAMVVGETHLVSRLIDGQYVDYEQIVPTSFNTEVIVSKNQLANALKTTGIFSGGVQSVRLEFISENQTIKVASGAQELGESTVEVPCEIHGPDGVVIFNHRYILDCLQVIPEDEILFKFINDVSPAVITPKTKQDYRYLVMPIKS